MAGRAAEHGASAQRRDPGADAGEPARLNRAAASDPGGRGLGGGRRQHAGCRGRVAMAARGSDLRRGPRHSQQPDRRDRHRHAERRGHAGRNHQPVARCRAQARRRPPGQKRRRPAAGSRARDHVLSVREDLSAGSGSHPRDRGSRSEPGDPPGARGKKSVRHDLALEPRGKPRARGRPRAGEGRPEEGARFLRTVERAGLDPDRQGNARPEVLPGAVTSACAHRRS